MFRLFSLDSTNWPEYNFHNVFIIRNRTNNENTYIYISVSCPSKRQRNCSIIADKIVIFGQDTIDNVFFFWLIEKIVNTFRYISIITRRRKQ